MVRATRSQSIFAAGEFGAEPFPPAGSVGVAPLPLAAFTSVAAEAVCFVAAAAGRVERVDLFFAMKTLTLESGRCRE
jgi:hypothetical protein